MKKTLLATVFALTVFGGWAQEDEETFNPFAFLADDDGRDALYVDAIFGMPVLAGLFQDPFFGARIEYDFVPSWWGVEASYLYHSKTYFFFDHGKKVWYGPVVWSLSPEKNGVESDWAFYQTRHIVSFGGLYKWPHRYFNLSLGVGLLFQFFLLPEAADYYPDYKAAYEASQKGVQNLLGNYVRLGIDFAPFPLTTLGADLVFEVPSWARFATEVVDQFWPYIQSHAHLRFRAGFRI